MNGRNKNLLENIGCWQKETKIEKNGRLPQSTIRLIRVKQLKFEVTINFHKQLKLIFLHQEISKNLFLAVSEDFCFRLVKHKKLN